MTLVQEENITPGRQINSRTPILLNREDQGWCVRQGAVDVFFSAFEDGQPQGRRHFLFRALPGETLFPVVGSPSIGLMAVGVNGTEIVPLRSEASPELEQALTASQIETWVLHLLSYQSLPGPQPKLVYELLVGEGQSVASGISLRSTVRLLWLQHVSGASKFAGHQEIRVTPGQGVWPVGARCWLEFNSLSGINVMDTATAMAQAGFYEALAKFHSVYMSFLWQYLEDEKVEEKARLTHRIEEDARQLLASTARLNGILAPEATELVTSLSSSSALLAACRRIGSELGFSIPDSRHAGGVASLTVDDIARLAKVRYRMVILAGKWQASDNGPLLVFRKEDHRPLALIPDKKLHYHVFDPADKSFRPLTEQDIKSLKPDAYTFYRSFPDRPLQGRDLMTFGVRMLKRDIWRMILTSLAGSLLALLPPILIGVVFDTVIPEAATGELMQVAAILVACVLSIAIFNLTKKLAALRIAGRMDVDLQSAIWDRLMNLPAPFFRNYSVGDLAGRALGIQTIQQLLSGITLDSILNGCFSVAYLFLLFKYGWKLALVALVISACGLLFTLLVSRYVVSKQRVISDLMGKSAGTVLQLLNGIAKLRVAGAEDRAFTAWVRVFAEQRALSFKAGMGNRLMTVFYSVFPLVSTMIIFYWVQNKVGSSFTTGDFVAFTSAFGGFQGALMQLVSVLSSVLMAIPVYARLKPIISAMPETDDQKAHPGQLSGQIEVSHVSFRYENDGPLILDEVSLKICPGEFVALVGDSGSGKSTLLRLLLGFEKPLQGGVFYDAQDLSSLDVREVRRQCGVVLQNGRLMAGDIFHNIVGASNLMIEDAWKAAQRVGIDDDIKQMPMGMHTFLTEGAMTLSGGQRQRLLIARAIVRQPRLLYFDEATSALDNRTQAIVSQSLEQLKVSRLVIAHRLSTIVKADRIYVMRKGRVIETGNYEELIRQNGLFAELASRQLA